jgi:acyl-CoA thioesterase FadM
MMPRCLRLDCKIIEDTSGEHLPGGYVTVVCVDAERFKSIPIPDAVREVIQNA